MQKSSSSQQSDLFTLWLGRRKSPPNIVRERHRMLETRTQCVSKIIEAVSLLCWWSKPHRPAHERYLSAATTPRAQHPLYTATPAQCLCCIQRHSGKQSCSHQLLIVSLLGSGRHLLTHRILSQYNTVE